VDSIIKLIGNPESLQRLQESETALMILRGITMPCLAYLLQSIAFLINIQRWNIILSGGQTVSLHQRKEIHSSHKVGMSIRTSNISSLKNSSLASVEDLLHTDTKDRSSVMMTDHNSVL
jgi:hypothetical protein